ncbi:GIY-YIG nuclease family protein [Sphingomicrobium sp. XHP0235]|uniref:GIY-YIG nuclease family protein n=1 Tax=Sphingomicrobium aquimarinum TaxID=3133971 RepID=UPI0031FEEA11
MHHDATLFHLCFDGLRILRRHRAGYSHHGFGLLMETEMLRTSYLLDHGFRALGNWSLDGEAIVVPEGVVDARGVYAFAIDGEVQYVGLASKSLRKRLYFYAKPASTQITNIRLNNLIAQRCRAGRKVEVLVAQPGDAEWNGLRVSGPEGLEAALIEDFDLPWNARGARKASVARPVRPKRNVGTSGKSTVNANAKAELLSYIRKRPGMTEIELAGKMFGRGTPQQRVNPICRALVAEGLIVREGRGGQGDPFTYRAR